MSNPETLEITIEDKKRTITMTHGLKRRLARKLETPEEAVKMSLDFDLSEEIVIMVLAARQPNGDLNESQPMTPEILSDLMDSDGFSEETYNDVINWVQGHIIDFFLLKAKSLMERITQVELDNPVLADLLSKYGQSGQVLPISTP